jgi:hypothetical protein
MVPLDSTRRKMSEGLKEKWQDPEHRAAVSAALQGRPPWNKGRAASEETREKMRAAKLNHHVSRATRQKMADARRGRALPPEAAALVSAALSGRPKSEEHKRSIAATQRKRHAAIRVLRAVEAVYESSSSSAGEGEGAGGDGAAARPARPPPLGVLPAAAGGPRRAAKSQFLGAFKAELREYRALQQELSPWNEAFVERHGRRPTMVDVQRTGIDWLVARYKQYVVLRERLFSDTSVLRAKLGAPDGGGRPAGPALGDGPINANGPTFAARAAVASRFSAAMEYKQGKQGAAPPPPPGVGLDGPEEAAAVTTASTSGAKVPSRVRTAMQAAQEYRNAKAAGMKAAAGAAAAAAKAGGPAGQRPRAALAPAPAPAALASAAAAPPGEGGAVAAIDGGAESAAPQAQQEAGGAEAEVRRILRSLDAAGDERGDGGHAAPLPLAGLGGA